MTSRQVRCVHRGDAACEFEGAWEADRPAVGQASGARKPVEG
jgi:hypothetical protein